MFCIDTLKPLHKGETELGTKKAYRKKYEYVT
jgi:hypothetical protein